MVSCEICLEEYREGELELHRDMCVVRLMFRCTLCHKDYVSKEGLFNHLELHKIADESKELHYQEIKAKYKLHQCPLCNDQRAYSEGLYWEHIQDVHDGFVIRCSDCGETFRSEKLKNEHAIGHCKSSDRTVISDFSDQKAVLVPVEEKELTADAKHLELSQSNTANGLPTLSTDNETGNSSIEKGSKSLPSGTGESKKLRSRFACDICGIEYFSVRGVSFHKRAKHDRKHKCPHCGRIFQMEEYQAHLPSCAKKKFSCESCHLKFRKPQYLAQHLKTVRCGKRRNEKRDQNSSSDAECLQCHKMCSSAYLLRQHISKCHEPTKCGICGITVYGLEKARYHKLTNHTEARYQCPHCSKNYHYAAKLKKHALRCAERKITCKLCNRKLKSPKSFKEHMRRIHGHRRSFATEGTVQENQNSDKHIDSDKSSTGGRGENSALELQGVGASSGLADTKYPHCEKDLSNGDSLPGHIEQCYFIRSQQSAIKHADLRFATKKIAPLQGQDSSNELYAKEIQTDCMNEPRPDNIEIKLEIKVEDTMMQEQGLNVLNKD